MNQLNNRKKSEVSRYHNLYSVDISDPSNFNVVIDTTGAKPEKIRDLILDLAERHWRTLPLNRHWVSPKALYPTADAAEITPEEAADIAADIDNEKFYTQTPILALKYLGKYFVIDGHRRTCAALQEDFDFVPVTVVPATRKIVHKGMSAEEFVKDRYDLERVKAWEDRFQFKFYEYPA